MTVLYSVATVYRRILGIEGVEERYDVSSLRCCNATGEALQEATYHEWKRRFGCDIYEHYGVSEMQMVLGQGPGRPGGPGRLGEPGRPVHEHRAVIAASEGPRVPTCGG